MTRAADAAEEQHATLLAEVAALKAERDEAQVSLAAMTGARDDARARIIAELRIAELRLRGDAVKFPLHADADADEHLAYAAAWLAGRAQ